MQAVMDFYQEDFERDSYLKVHDIMNIEEIQIYRDDTIETAIRIMEWEGLAHACVFDHQEKLVGVVNFEELLKVKKKSDAVNAYMHQDFHKIYGLLDADTGIKAVMKERYHCMPVFENQRIIGILNYESLFDVRYYN